jgi:hypothetical protein
MVDPYLDQQKVKSREVSLMHNTKKTTAKPCFGHRKAIFGCSEIDVIPSVDHQMPPGVSLEQYKLYVQMLTEYSALTAQ